VSKRVFLAVLAATFVMPAAAQAATQTVTFDTSGEHTFTVPLGVTSVRVVAIGGSGADNALSSASGGVGRSVTGDVPVQWGQVLYVEVGGNASGSGGGFNGGAPGGMPPTAGAAQGGGGGGASDIRGTARAIPGTLDSRILVSPGGGGAGWLGNGGNGGENGGDATGCAGSGGRAGGPGTTKGVACGSGADGEDGSLGRGGTGGATQPGAGGGGGGGYGGGGGASSDTAGSGGGGGGSVLVAPGVSLVSNDLAQTGTQPSVTVSYETPTADVTPANLTFATTPQGTVSGSRGLTVTNNGTGLLMVSGESFAPDGANPGADDFFVSSSNCGGLIAPAASCVIRFRFAPQAQGARSAVVHVETNAAGSPADIKLSGAGGPLPKGDKGDTGDTGPQGPKGDRGPAGRDATISCRVVKGKGLKKLRVICTLKFLNGRRVQRASAHLVRHGRTVAAGHARRRQGRLVLRLSGRAHAHPGWFTLRLVTVDRHGHRRSARYRIRVG
jgi:hypothetical protein